MTRPLAPRLTVVLLGLAFAGPSFLPLSHAAEASPATTAGTTAAPAAASASASAADIAYWRKLQAEIAALRSANSNIEATMVLLAPLPQVNAISQRVEDFLDARDADPVDDLSPDLVAYRAQLLAMLDSAMNPLRAAANFQEQLNEFNPQERMIQGTKYLALMRLVDEFKPALANLHEKISAAVVAAGGPRILFFQNLNLGDEAVVQGSLLSPLERDQRFVEESRAIDPGFATIVEEKFLAWRRDGRIDGELEAKRDQILESLVEFAEQTNRMSPEALQQNLEAAPPSDTDAFGHAVVQIALRLELLRRQHQSAAALRILDWKTAFARWLGKSVNDETIWDACRDVTFAVDGSRYAYSADGETVVVRATADDAVLASYPFSGGIRGLTFDAVDRLMVFTTAGLYQWADRTADEPTMRNQTISPNIAGRIGAATDRPRYFYAWSNLPEISDDGQTSTLRASGSSAISAIALDRSGRHVAIGYTGQNNLGGEDAATHGFRLLDLPAEMAEGNIGSTTFHPPYVEAVTALAFDADATHIAMATVAAGRGTVCVFDRAEGNKSRRIFTLDDQPYHWVAITSGEHPRVLAAARTGIIRAWDLATSELVARVAVPTGPQGVAVGLLDDQLIAVALGGDSILRFSLDDLSLVTVASGLATDLDTPTNRTAFATERALRPVIDQLAALVESDDPNDEVTIGRRLLAEKSPELDQLGRRQTLISIVGNRLADQTEALRKAEKYQESLALARQTIADGFGTRSLYWEAIVSARELDLGAEATKLSEQGLELFPTSSDLRYQFHNQRMLNFVAANNPTAALTEIDEMGNIRPAQRPYRSTRKWVYLSIASRAAQAGHKQSALDSYLQALDYCSSKEDQFELFGRVFYYAYELKNWQLSVNIANAWLNADEAKKNDQSFMDCARYAYSQLPQK